MTKIHKNNAAKVSVIIPVYNTEKYLRKCLDSVCGQTLQDIEIICINDCSPDDSLQILKEYASNDNRIKIINFKENKGVAIARNTGIDTAKGEYIGFVDSDDFIDLDFYEKLYEKAVESKAEVVKGADIEAIIEGQKEQWQQNKAIKKDKYNFTAQFYSAIFQRNFLITHNVKFPQNFKIFEDIIFAHEAVHYAKSICVIDEAIYHYVRHSGSACAINANEKFDLVEIDCFFRYADYVVEFVHTKSLPLESKRTLLLMVISLVVEIKKLNTKIIQSYTKQLIDLQKKLILLERKLK